MGDPTRTAQAVGDVLEERYVLRRRLGEGASGIVWLAHDKRRDIEVAVKILRESVALRPEALERFASEGEISERMLSPHIVRILGRGILGDGLPYIAQEFLDGEDLASRLKRGPLSLDEMKIVVIHTCRALARAHAVGVIHRDIKPANLFLTNDADGRRMVKVLDFGVAEIVADCGPNARGLYGTLEYIAPEVLRAALAADARSDLYSLAAVAYECLTGRVPVIGDTLGQLLLRHASEDVEPASARCPTSSQPIDDWFRRGLARDRDARFSDAKEMAETLADASRGSIRRESEVKTIPESGRHRVHFEWEESRTATYAIVHPRTPKRAKGPG